MPVCPAVRGLVGVRHVLRGVGVADLVVGVGRQALLVLALLLVVATVVPGMIRVRVLCDLVLRHGQQQFPAAR